MARSNVSDSQPSAIEVEIVSGELRLGGTLAIPGGSNATGVVAFAHGSGSGRHSPRNRFVAEVLNRANIATLLFDLLTVQEEAVDARTGHLRFDIGLLADRLVSATHWLRSQTELSDLPLGYFGASTGGGAALVAAAELGDEVRAVVSRGGRPDLAGRALPRVKAPTLLLVGGLDGPVIGMNEAACAQLRCTKELVIVPGATHLFQEPGTLETVAGRAAEWFNKYLPRHPPHEKSDDGGNANAG